ncbi:MAG TPA: RodZ domain-containing protein [Rudaea sp.]|nr:RodZ domain-containing protein [Rudaea sp.]
METMQSQGADVAQRESPPEPVVAAPHDARSDVNESLGQRLRAAREARGWSGADVATRLHLPIQIVQTIEADRYDAIGHRIYLRGYLTSYLRLLDLPTILVESVLQQHAEPPPLMTSGTISHSRYLFQRYSVSALYLILTGVIIVPAVLLAMRAGLEPKMAELTTLETTSGPAASESNDTVAQDVSSGSAVNPAADTTAPAGAPPAGAAAADSPLVASMAPFQALARKDSPAAQPPAAPAVGSGAHTLRLTLKEASWVEIISASGEKLEYGLLPAGTVKTIGSDVALDVRLGNSSGAEVEIDGQMQDLTPYRHANIAHFKAFAAGQPISHTD